MKKKYDDQWRSFINRVPQGQDQGNKLRIYNKFKDLFQMEKYLRAIPDRRTRIEICKLRISAHNLMVERMRYSRPKPKLDDRLCKFCQCADTEFHFIFQCCNNATLRTEMFSDILQIFPQFHLLPPTAQFIRLMECSDVELMKIFGKFVVSSVHKRNES